MWLTEPRHFDALGPPWRGPWPHEVLAVECSPRETPRYRQLKLDGHRLAIFTPIHEDRDIIALSSGGHDLWPQLRELPLAEPISGLPLHTSIDGELYLLDQPATEVTRALAARDGQLMFGAFAVPVWRGRDLRDEALEVAANICRQHEIAFARFEAIGSEIEVEVLLKDLPEGAEGWVLKTSNYRSWWKVKPVKTIDLIVVAVRRGTGTWFNLDVAAVGPDGEMAIVARISGRGVPETQRGLALIGRIAEVEYQGVCSGGRLRHATFRRWREDKTIDRCGLDQDRQLLAKRHRETPCARVA